MENWIDPITSTYVKDVKVFQSKEVTVQLMITVWGICLIDS